MPKSKYERDEDIVLDERFVYKNMKIESTDVTDDDLKKINKLTLEPLTKEDVFIFKMNMADNELDDRNYEPFNLNALKDLAKLYVGKTVIKDHYRRADNQVARVYDTELVSSKDKVTGAGEVHTDLIGKVYMVKTATNADLITEIKAGIKKEVSTGCSPKKAICSICGADNVKTPCTHWWGKEYDTANGKRTCYFTLDGAKEAYEVSFVAVPAQPRAATCKCYDAIKSKDEVIQEEESKVKMIEESKKLQEELGAEMDAINSFLFTQKQKNHSKN